MAEHKLVLIIPNASNKKVFHSIDLEGSHESYPEDYFRNEENRSRLRQDLEDKSARQVSDAHLNQIITNLVSDIKSGYQPTTITLDLPPKENFTPKQTSNPPIPKEAKPSDIYNPPPKKPTTSTETATNKADI